MLIAGILDLELPRTAEFLTRFGTSEDERQAQRYKHPLPRRQSIAARALLRFLLAEMLGPAGAGASIERAPNGNPLIDQAGVHVALSHSSQRVAAAVSDAGAVGIDIERLKPDRPIRRIVEFVIDRASHTELSARRSDELYRVWTIVECLRKATDIALPAPLPPSFVRGVLQSRSSTQRFPPHHLLVGSTIEDGYAVAIALALGSERTEVGGDWPVFMPDEDGLLIARSDYGLVAAR